MTNKQIASGAIISLAVFIVAYLSGGETNEGFTMFAYYASLIGFYVFNIWGYVRLFKSDK
jgi:hypothetical protein